MKQVEPNLAQINRKPNDGNNSKNAKMIFFLTRRTFNSLVYRPIIYFKELFHSIFCGELFLKFKNYLSIW